MNMHSRLKSPGDFNISGHNKRSTISISVDIGQYEEDEIKSYFRQCETVRSEVRRLGKEG